MDLVSLLRTLSDHNQQVIGALIVIILATAGLLMARSALGKGDGTAHAGGPVKADIDLGAIESAFKRVLAAQGGAPVAAASGVASSAPAEGDASKIQELAREIDRLTTELASKTDGPGFGGTGVTGAPVAEAGAVAELKAKITELEGKLTEYEIIEDDIADLSRFKEENAELRSELDSLKANVGSGTVTAAPTPAPAAAPAPVVEASVPVAIEEQAPAAANTAIDIDAVMAALDAQEAATAAAAAPPVVAAAPVPPTPAVAPAPAKPAVNTEAADVAMKEFASSVDMQRPAINIESGSDLNEAVAAAALAGGGSVLDDSLDTEKMMSEVASLSTDAVADDAGLDGALDTEKLLAEMGNLEPAASAPAAAPAPAPAAAPAMAPQPAPLPPTMAAPDALVFEDDLLAEFKESNDGGQG